MLAPADDPVDARAKPKKAPNAFRPISEVAAELPIPPHALRFRQTMFPQLKPLNRGGGRRLPARARLRARCRARGCGDDGSGGADRG